MAETKKSSKKTKKSSLAFLKDERFKKITGVLMVLISFFLLVSFASYLVTWKQDQSLIIDHPWKQVFNTSIDVKNHLGNLGAVVSHQFIYYWYGIASFAFVIWFFTLGINIFFSKRVFNNAVIIGEGVVIMIWTSIMLGFFLNNASFAFGGAFGVGTADYLESILGKIGAILILTATLVIYLILFTKFNFSFLLNVFKNKPKVTDADPLTEDDTLVANELPDNKETKENIFIPPVYTSRTDIEDPVQMELKKVDPVKDVVSPIALELDEPVIADTLDEIDNENTEELPLDIEEGQEEKIALENQHYNFDPILDLPHYKYPLSLIHI